MATEKVTPMILKVDLQCPCCYKKIKKTLCKFPQIRDQVYDEKNNQVAITVVCCSPEKIRDKLCCKGGKAIKSITIVEKPKPKEPEKPKAAPADKPKEPEKPKLPPADKPKEPEKPKAAAGKPKEPEKPKAADKPKDKPAGPEKPKSDGKGEKPKGDGGAPPAEKPKEAPKPEPAKMAEPVAMPPAALQMMGPGPALVHGVPSIFPYCGPSHDPYAVSPYYSGYGFPPASQPMYDGYGYGHGNGQAHGYGYGYVHGGVTHAHVNKNENYFSDENPQTCTIM